ncbi:hypothetical protein CU102_19625 [Phyllobacterium brassicacearum]|uniref:Uncharacterized protein n=1 Tax=Phyllobacterium brassicacearum TaxID=314235 RepID=A0A2P7BGV8_9HYPH|nr:hypothetical protein CU102_19625 [Phyllobacterium brassicacearum]
MRPTPQLLQSVMEENDHLQDPRGFSFRHALRHFPQEHRYYLHFMHQASNGCNMHYYSMMYYAIISMCNAKRIQDLSSAAESIHLRWAMVSLVSVNKIARGGMQTILPQKTSGLRQ